MLSKCTLVSFSLTLLIGSACKKDADNKPAAPEPTEEAAGKAAAPNQAKTAEADATEAVAKVETQLATLEGDKALEEARWRDNDLESKLKAMLEDAPKEAPPRLAAILASAHRSPGFSKRDAHRHPKETLSFFQLEPFHTVVEMGIGNGWYTEILAPFLANEGKLIVGVNRSDAPKEDMVRYYAQREQNVLKKSPTLYGKVEVFPRARATNEEPKIAASGTVDRVLAIREMHGWVRREQLEDNLAGIHKALKTDGQFCVVQHRAAEGSDASESVKNGYLPQDWVIKSVEKAGFALRASSEINANAKDTKNYDEGVWTLPPSFTLGDEDREKYAAIGESDRMTLCFLKKESEDSGDADDKSKTVAE